MNITGRLSSKPGNSNIRVRLQVVSIDGVVQIQGMASSLVHAVGHIDKGRARNEDYVIQYSYEQFGKLLKKK